MFGGGDALPKYSRKLDKSEQMPVGDKNSLAAFEFLMEAGVNIATAHVGEQGYRRIIFDISTGDVWVKFTSLAEHHINTRSLSGRN